MNRVRKNESRSRSRTTGRKRRRSRSDRIRLRFLWVLGVVTLLAIGGWGYVRVMPVLSEWTTIQQITVLGLDRIRRNEVVALLNFPPDASLLTLKTDPLIERLESHPWIAAASVERVFPDSLAISIMERKPAAVLQSPEGAHLLDEEGFLLSAIPAHPLPPLPIVHGLTPSDFHNSERHVREQARKAIQAANILTNELEGVPTVQVTPQSTFVAELAKTRFFIGSSFDDQWQRFQALYPFIQDRIQSTPKEIDLRYAGKVILRERE
ncbi:MAG: FtsQ-type POTRA domain-containing protein [Nitrospirales bacterium]|nr:FtsQ-type POTRA domain-containing protein [Nitrospirales bacterium]